MSKKLYVGNLSYGVTSESLKALFSTFGTVESAEVIKDQYSGQSKGFGFVEMADPKEATTAIEGLDGKEHEGRNLKVSEAKPMDESERPRRPPRRDFDQRPRRY